MNYVISDIHGCYKEFLMMLEKIRFSDEDRLYLLGDLIDRGPEPIELLLDVMKRQNVLCVAGNHEVMALESFGILLVEVTDENIWRLSTDKYEALVDWYISGGESTISGMQALDKEKRREVLEFIMNFDVYEEIKVNGQDYILVHAGIDNFSPERSMYDYELEELIWTRPDYSRQYFEDKIVVSGHTPTRNIDSSGADKIIKINNHIAIDCGCCFGGRLGAICLETGEEFYVSSQNG